MYSKAFAFLLAASLGLASVFAQSVSAKDDAWKEANRWAVQQWLNQQGLGWIPQYTYKDPVTGEDRNPFYTPWPTNNRSSRFYTPPPVVNPYYNYNYSPYSGFGTHFGPY